MTTNAQRTVVGVFNDQGLADTAVEELQNAGFTADQIYYSGPGEDEKEYFDTAFWREVRKHLFYGKAVSHDDLTKHLKTLGFSNDEIAHYDSEYHNGRVIVAVKAPGREEEALAILRVNGAHN